MKHLLLILVTLFSVCGMSAYNPYDENIHTVGNFIFEVEINAGKETGYATLIDVKPNTVLKGEVTIPGSVTIDGVRYIVNHIGYVYVSSRFFERDRAIKDFPEITRVNIPSTITGIGYMEFLGCTGINEFHVNANNLYFKDEDGILFHRWDENSSWQLFRMPPARPKTKYTLPDDVKRIEQCAFADQKTLRQIILSPNFYFSDPLWAWGNKSIREIDVSKTNLKSQGGIIFEEWGYGVELLACPPGLKLDSYTVPANCHTIADGAFCNSSIQHIKLNESLVILREYAFAGSDIEELEVPAELLREGRYGICLMAKRLKKLHITGSDIDKAYLDKYSFALCSNLTEVVSNSNYLQLQTGAFYGCTSLKEFPFGCVETMEGSEDTYTYSGEGRQFQSSGLEVVDFPSHLSKVPEYCFCNCSNLKEVHFNQDQEKTKKIDIGAFQNCSSLESIELNGLTYVGGGAFEDTPIKKIIVPSEKNNENNLNIGLSFDFLSDTKWYIDSPRVKWVSADGSNNMTTATFVVSCFQEKRTVPNHWKQLYCPSGMKDYYENLYENHNWGGPVSELFSFVKKESQPFVIIKPNTSLSEISIEITGVTINGKKAQFNGDGIWSVSGIESLTNAQVRVDYMVDNVPMSTTYPPDYTTGVSDVMADSKEIIGIYDIAGKYVGTAIEKDIHGIYIIRFNDGTSQKIIIK